MHLLSMDIRFYKIENERDFNNSVYSKELIYESERGMVWWGHSSFGQIHNQSCLWVKKNNKDVYYTFIIESPIRADNQEDKEELKRRCESLLID